MDDQPVALSAEMREFRPQPGHVGLRSEVEPAGLQLVRGLHRHTCSGHGLRKPAFACLELQEQDDRRTCRMADWHAG